MGETKEQKVTKTKLTSSVQRTSHLKVIYYQDLSFCGFMASFGFERGLYSYIWLLVYVFPWVNELLVLVSYFIIYAFKLSC